MKLTSDIVIVDCSKEDFDHINSLFFVEDKEILNGRASFTMSSKPSKNLGGDYFDVYFHLRAEDVTALRAVFTLVVKVLNVFEKTKQLINGGKND
jgi:hypothetical protein